jgi:hypothetical protein
MGYDTGLKVGEHACTIPECTADHTPTDATIPAPDSKVGFYAPIKKQTEAFVKRS